MVLLRASNTKFFGSFLAPRSTGHFTALILSWDTPVYLWHTFFMGLRRDVTLLQHTIRGRELWKVKNERGNKYLWEFSVRPFRLAIQKELENNLNMLMIPCSREQVTWSQLSQYKLSWKYRGKKVSPFFFSHEKWLPKFVFGLEQNLKEKFAIAGYLSLRFCYDKLGGVVFRKTCSNFLVISLPISNRILIRLA